MVSATSATVFQCSSGYPPYARAHENKPETGVAPVAPVAHPGVPATTDTRREAVIQAAIAHDSALQRAGRLNQTEAQRIEAQQQARDTEARLRLAVWRMLGKAREGAEGEA